MGIKVGRRHSSSAAVEFLHGPVLKGGFAQECTLAGRPRAQVGPFCAPAVEPSNRRRCLLRLVSGTKRSSTLPLRRNGMRASCTIARQPAVVGARRCRAAAAAAAAAAAMVAAMVTAAATHGMIGASLRHTIAPSHLITRGALRRRPRPRQCRRRACRHRRCRLMSTIGVRQRRSSGASVQRRTRASCPRGPRPPLLHRMRLLRM